MKRRHLLMAMASAGLTAALRPAGALAQGVGCLDCAPRLLYVDLGRAMLYAVEGVRLVIVSRVIVGAPHSPTPWADSVVSHVRFRPTWRPTPSMIASGRYEDGLRPPGPSNPLGLAAIHYRDGGLVYLHGTNQPELFGRERRALSNGCVRVEALDPLVAWLLGWSPETVASAMRGRRTFDAPAQPVPILMTGDTRHPMLSVLSRLSDGLPMGLQPT